MERRKNTRAAIFPCFKTNACNEFFCEIFESIYDGVFITDGECVVQYVNRGYERISGLHREDLLGRKMEDLIEMGYISNSVSLLVKKARKPLTIEQVFSGGKIAIVSGNPVYDEDGNLANIVTSVRDISEITKLKDQLLATVQQRDYYQQQLDMMRNHLIEDDSFIVVSDSMKEILTKAEKVAPLDTTVLITGETGVGKNEVANYIHRHSRRHNKPFVTINCSVLPESLIESNLFGYEEGAFTGAHREGKIGLFEIAEGGTVFLDEIGELSINMQTKLLRVLEERKFERLGSNKVIDINVRVIVATNRNLVNMIEKKLFREDLFYRINIYPLEVPPLRDRKEDIIPLANLFLEKLNQRYERRVFFTSQVLKTMHSYKWPGNVRELRNIVERSYVTCNGTEIREKDLGLGISPSIEVEDAMQDFDLKRYLEEKEIQIMEKYYEAYGSVRDAAAALHMTPSTFVRKRQRYTKG